MTANLRRSAYLSTVTVTLPPPTLPETTAGSSTFFSFLGWTCSSKRRGSAGPGRRRFRGRWGSACMSWKYKFNKKTIRELHNKHEESCTDRDKDVEADEGVGRPADAVEEAHQRQEEGHVLNTLGGNHLFLHSISSNMWANNFLWNMWSLYRSEKPYQSHGFMTS